MAFLRNSKYYIMILRIETVTARRLTQLVVDQKLNLCKYFLESYYFTNSKYEVNKTLISEMNTTIQNNSQ